MGRGKPEGMGNKSFTIEQLMEKAKAFEKQAMKIVDENKNQIKTTK